MARSKDAIERRALKRNKSIPEQSRNDAKEMRRQDEKEQAEVKRRRIGDNHHEERPSNELAKPSPTKALETANQSENGADPKNKGAINTYVRVPSTFGRDPLEEPGNWHCPGCGNHNFPSRNSCRSKTCDERRPAGVFVPPRFKKPNTRHDESTSKKLSWAKQADQQTLDQNRELREKFQETGGEGMEEEDIERAKILIARDERKKNKKKKRKQVH